MLCTFVLSHPIVFVIIVNPPTLHLYNLSKMNEGEGRRTLLLSMK